MSLVTERWSTRTLARGASAVREFDVTGVDDEDAAETALSMYVTPDQVHPLDDSIRIPTKGGIEWKIIVPSKHYRASVKYQRPGNGSTGTAALAEKWKCKASWQTESVPMVRDATGLLVANTAGDVFVPGLTRQLWSMEIIISRWELGTDIVSKNLTFANRYNTDSVTLPKIGTCDAGVLLMKSIYIDDEFRSDEEAVMVRYAMLAKAAISLDGTAPIHGHHKRVPSLGTRAYGDTGSNIVLANIVCCTGVLAGRPVRESVRLDDTGKMFDFTSFGVDVGATGFAVDNPSPFSGPFEIVDGTCYQYFDPTDGGVAFSGLNIAANI